MKKMSFKKKIIPGVFVNILAIMLLAVSCAMSPGLDKGGEEKNSTTGNQVVQVTAGTEVVKNAASVNPGQWALVFSDEFNYSGKPDSSKWDYDIGIGLREDGWGSWEEQYYTDNLRNASVGNGKLTITALKEDYGSIIPETGADHRRSYTSARLVTRGKAELGYGRYEFRAKLPSGRGTWPAIWMLGADYDVYNWPDCGEIDIVEHVGTDPDGVLSGIHCAAYNFQDYTAKNHTQIVPTAETEFHHYAMEWDEDKIEIFIDGVKHFTFNNEHTGSDSWPFDKPFYMILNIAIGGGWGGQKGIDDSIFPQSMEIDYVRFYKKKSVINSVEGYTKCADENDSYFFEEPVDVAYGANGTYYYLNGVTGNITFNNAAFGDPIPGVYKAGYYRIAANVALGKNTVQSSTGHSGVSSRAVDGNTDGIYGNQSVTHTAYESGAWWKVDLGSTHQVNRVRIWNRTECSDRLANFSVDYLDQNGNVIVSQDHPGIASAQTDIELYAMQVYAVRVRLNGTNYLSLAEVEVFGSEIEEQWPGEYVIVSKLSGKCLDIAGFSTDNAANVHQWGYKQAANQKWKIESTGGGRFRIISLFSGLALDAEGGTYTNGTNVDQYAYGGINQEWHLTYLDNGYFSIVNANNSLALDVEGNSIEEGANIHLWEFCWGDNQQWEIVRVDNIEEQWPGEYAIISKSSGKCLDVAAYSTENGANVHQWGYTGAVNQKWKIESTLGGRFKIVSLFSGLALDAEGGTYTNGTNVDQYAYDGINQEWHLTYLDNGYFSIVNANNSLALDVAGNSYAEGANIHLWEFCWGDNQQWEIVRTD